MDLPIALLRGVGGLQALISRPGKGRYDIVMEPTSSGLLDGLCNVHQFGPETLAAVWCVWLETVPSQSSGSEPPLRPLLSASRVLKIAFRDYDLRFAQALGIDVDKAGEDRVKLLVADECWDDGAWDFQLD